MSKPTKEQLTGFVDRLNDYGFLRIIFNEETAKFCQESLKAILSLIEKFFEWQSMADSYLDNKGFIFRNYGTAARISSLLREIRDFDFGVEEKEGGGE